MIESFCCTLIAVIFYITAGQYEEKFEVLEKFKLPLLIVSILLAVVTLFFMAMRIIDAIKGKPQK